MRTTQLYGYNTTQFGEQHFNADGDNYNSEDANEDGSRFNWSGGVAILWIAPLASIHPLSLSSCSAIQDGKEIIQLPSLPRSSDWPTLQRLDGDFWGPRTFLKRQNFSRRRPLPLTLITVLL